MVKIVHASDWHGTWQHLPPADIYVFTGDMLPNFPDIAYRCPQTGDRKWIGYSAGELGWGRPNRLTIDGDSYVYDLQRRVDPAKEAVLQTRWANENLLEPFLGNQDAPVVLLRGNHDFIPLSTLFPTTVCYTINGPGDEREICGLRFGGARGIPFIAGEWSDEMQEDQRREIFDAVSLDIDVLVTHTPPSGVIDLCVNQHIGCTQVSRWLQRRGYQVGMSPLRAHLFGHCHTPEMQNICSTVFSNAATTYNVIELE